MSDSGASFIALIVVGAIVIWGACSIAFNAGRADTTYKVCNTSHMIIDGEWERACGLVQDASDTEFLCDDTKCWAEAK